MARKIIKIEYTARYWQGSYKPVLCANGLWLNSTARYMKTERGALNKAKRMAEQHAESYWDLYNDVTVSQWQA